ncbi:biliverdin-producing heme oxygenase [Glycomyces xiaoerkulensis]|uniref:biliverdin-producing heme oxygenase n=1 Tax=Glycomyces xiaoerkulensis TaxID=2038139 RepID=UPI000C259A81|nr:biliverdin-producing heme oxygenase [Glycomyces xiaoerkulensis]
MPANTTAEDDVESLPFSARIRRASWSRHRALDPTDGPQARGPGVFDRLFDGTLSREDYTRWHAQQLFVYEAIEAAGERWRGDAVAGAFVFDELLRTEAIESDLEFLIGPDWRDRVAPLESTRRYVGRINATAPVWAGGYIAHSYTRYLGDLSGGQAFGKAAREHLGLEAAGAGFYRFDSIPDPKAFKADYRSRLDAVALGEADRRRVIDEVLIAYDHNGAVLDELASGLADANPFGDEAVDAICRHMNDDHAEDTLVICRGAGGRPEATAARMTGLDGEAGEYAVTVGGAEETIRIRWSRRLTERAEVRPEVVRLFTESKELLRHTDRV